MTYVLGIDTGGTFTDGVIIERESKNIIEDTKARTTHEELVNGISEVINNLTDANLAKVDYVALSTTLATNAVVEDKGCRVGLLLLGNEADDTLPPCKIREINGSIDLSGHEVVPLDIKALESACADFKDEVDAVAVSGIFSIRNPFHEEEAASYVREHINLPVIMAHELTGTLGVRERTNTAILNARLISVIDNLIKAVKTAMLRKNLNVPLMIVKGDGSLMNESIALNRPIETILSGPASSIIGATYLQDIDDGLVVDIGGTTTDVALLKNGKPTLTQEGSDVGGFKTRVSAVNAYTYGLGGDSYFHRDVNTGKWVVGPMRSWPVSVIAGEYPHYEKELVYSCSTLIGMLRYGPCDGLIFLHSPGEGTELSEVQEKIIAAVADGPHTLIEIGKRIGVDPNFFRLDELLHYGILGMIGFTPTDVLCAAGELKTGNRNGAILARNAFARNMDMDTVDFDALCRQRVRERLQDILLDCVLQYQGKRMDTLNPAAIYLYQKGMERKKDSLLNIEFNLSVPVIGIGAPVKAWLPQAVEGYHSDTVFDTHYEVANAIGAAAGEVMHICNITVENKNQQYLAVYTPWGYRECHRPAADEAHDLIPFPDFIEQTVADVIAEGKQRLTKSMEQQGIHDFRILEERHDKCVSGGYNKNLNLYIESKIELVAVGLPEWQRQGRCNEIGPVGPVK